MKRGSHKINYMKIGLIVVTTFLTDFHLVVETNILKSPTVDFHFYNIHSLDVLHLVA